MKFRNEFDLRIREVFLNWIFVLLIVVFNQYFNFFVLKVCARNDIFLNCVNENDVVKFENNEKLNVFEIFLLFDDNKTNKNKYLCLTSSIIFLNIFLNISFFFVSRIVIKLINVNFYSFSLLFDSIFVIFVKLFCDIFKVLFVKKNSIISWVKSILLKQ